MLRQSAGTGRVRVTRRISSKPDHRGRRRLIARKGSELSVSEAVRRGISVQDLEPIGNAGKRALEVLADTKGKRTAKHADAAEAAARDADRAAQRESEQARADAARNASKGGLEFPQRRGGPNWTLSDGSTFKGSRADAEAAEVALQEQASDDAGDGDTDGGSAGDPGEAEGTGGDEAEGTDGSDDAAGSDDDGGKGDDE